MTLLIVEDEDIIRKGLIVTIRKLQLDFEHIYEARDGKEALSLCQEYEPDLIITDIRMPLMDGLTFIKESQIFLPESQYIILSGYNDFDYARTALKYGVKDYLLKPSTKKEIYEVLIKVMGNIKQQQVISLELANQLNSFQQKIERFQELFLGNLLIGRYPTTDIAQYLSHYSIHFEKRMLAVVCIKMYPSSESDIASIDYKTHFDWFRTLLERYTTVFQTDILSVYKTVILNFSKDGWDSLNAVWQAIEAKVQCYEKDHLIQIRFSVSRSETSVDILPSLYEEANMLLHYRLFLSNLTPFDSKNTNYRATKEPAIPLTKIETIYHDFLGNSQFALRQSFLAFVSHTAKIADTSPHYFLICMKKLEEYFTFQLAQDNLTSENTYQIELAVKESFTTCDRLDELAEVLYKKLLYFWKIKKEGNYASTSNVSSPIDYAISYIEQNYYMDLTLGMMADLISMNSSYFSSLFKKKTGLNFVNYLQNVRIEKSKKLLLNSNQKLYEISESVGIPNVKYFCKIFKDYTEVTPSEFRHKIE